ncbi:MAG TPA: hypothetical protein VE344_08215 [Methylomirabilota bacterium]|nr:hypothetical protein [Methylomirabilota bacterium]
MIQKISTKNPTDVAKEVQATYLQIFPGGDKTFVPHAFQWASDCFEGKYADFQPVDARYHDFEHTLQGALCMARILRGRHRAWAQPALPQRMAELGLVSILLHDTGYLKKRGDDSGTGAKYTSVHVGRSAEFAGQLLTENGFSAMEIASVQNMICCTGVDALLKVIPFQSELEKITGLCLGAADLLGQMAADDYIEKLPVLYAEFAEAARGSPQKSGIVNMFSSAKDLLRKTPDFWEQYVKVKLERDFGGQYRYLNDPYPDGANEYMEKIEANVRRLRKLISSEADTTAFLKKHCVA